MDGDGGERSVESVDKQSSLGDRRKIVKKLSMFGTNNIDNFLTIYRIVEKLRKLMVIKFRNLIKKYVTCVIF